MRYFYKSVLAFGILFLTLLVVVLMQKVDPRQSHLQVSALQFPDTLNPNSLKTDSLWQVVGNHKTTPEGFTKAALVAYSAYPELKDARIEMILTNSGAPMESNFKLWTLLGKRENRVYQVLLNDAKESPFEPILLRNLPFNAQVGILAHELGHVVYYQKLSSLQIAKWGIMYLASGNFRAVHERTTDLMTVRHGLGQQIYDYAYFIRHDSTCLPLYKEYKEFADTYYMTDVELKDAMESTQK